MLELDFGQQSILLDIEGLRTVETLISAACEADDIGLVQQPEVVDRKKLIKHQLRRKFLDIIEI